MFQLFDVGDKHKLQQVDEDVGTFTQNLESFAALDLEGLHSVFHDFPFGRGSKNVLFARVVDVGLVG